MRAYDAALRCAGPPEPVGAGRPRAAVARAVRALDAFHGDSPPQRVAALSLLGRRLPGGGGPAWLRSAVLAVPQFASPASCGWLARPLSCAAHSALAAAPLGAQRGSCGVPLRPGRSRRSRGVRPPGVTRCARCSHSSQARCRCATRRVSSSSSSPWPSSRWSRWPTAPSWPGSGHRWPHHRHPTSEATPRGLQPRVPRLQPRVPRLQPRVPRLTPLMRT